MRKICYLLISIFIHWFIVGCQFHADINELSQKQPTEISGPENVPSPIEKNSVLFQIESAPSGSGSNLSTLTVNTGTSTNLYSVKRDQSGSFIENAAVSWGIDGSVGSLNIAADTKSVTFIAGALAGSSTVSIYSDGKLTQQLTMTVVMTDDLKVNNLSISNITTNSFDANLFFENDSNNNAQLILSYCNLSDSPGCVPPAPPAVPNLSMVRSTGSYSRSVTGLISPNDPGDTLKVKIYSSDADGVTELTSMETNVTLALPTLGSFTVSGVTAASDSITDDFLSNATSPTLTWTTSSNATSYEISIFEDDGTTTKCPSQITTNTTLAMGVGCSLTAGQYYKASVVAKYNVSATLAASNSLFRFYVNRSPVAGSDGLGPWYVKAGGSLALNVIWAAAPSAGVASDPDGHSMVFSSIVGGTLGTISIGGGGTSLTYTASSGGNVFGRDSFDATIADDKGGTYTATIIVHVMQDYSWTGKLSSAWNAGGNWCGTNIAADKRSCSGAASAPGASSTTLTLYFDDTCTSPYTCSPITPSNISVQGIRMQANGFTQNTGHTLTLGSGGWSMTGGIFNGGNSTITISSTTAINLSVNGGTFNSTTGLLDIVLSNNAYAGFQLGASGSFVHQNGTVKFQITDRDGYSLDINTLATFYNLIYSSNATCCGDTTAMALGTGNKIVVQNDFTMQREGGSAANGVAANGGTIEVLGNIKAINGGGIGGGTSILALVGTGNQTYQDSSGGSFPILEINKSTGTVEPEVTTNNLLVSRFILTQGSFLAPPGEFIVRSNEPSGTTIFDTSASGSNYSHNNGTLKFLARERMGYNIDLNSQLNVYNLVYTTNAACCSSDTRPFTLGSADKFIVENDLTIRKESGAQGYLTLNSGSIDVLGNIHAMNGGGGGGTTQIGLVGTGIQTYNSSGGGGRFPGVYINKASGIVSAGVGTTDFTVSRLYLLQGVFDAPTGYFTIQNEEAGGTVVWSSANGTIFNHNNGTLRFASHSRNSYNIDLNNQLQVFNLIYTVTYSCCGGDDRRFTLGAGEKFIVENDFTSKIESGMSGYMGANGGSIDLYGSLIVQAGSNGGTTNTNMLGSNNATITQSGGVPPGGTLTLAKSGGAFVDLLTNLNLTTTGQDLIIQSEALRMNGLNLTVQDNLTIQSGATLNAGGGIYTPNSLPKLLNNGTIVP